MFHDTTALQNSHPFVRLQRQAPIWVCFYHLFGHGERAAVGLNALLFIVARLQKQVRESLLEVLIHLERLPNIHTLQLVPRSLFYGHLAVHLIFWRNANPIDEPFWYRDGPV